jgi:phosphatidylserine/phosphatidylglycerophosphate/cardiolipin synthase-like enzyme
MPTLDELKEKWFIPMDGSSPDLVPCRRHTEDAGLNTLSVSTDGNRVTPLIDGKAYMKRWRDELLALHGVAGAEFFHTGWRLEGVKILGISAGGNDALDDINDIDESGVATYLLLSRHMAGINFNRPASIWLIGHGVWHACLDNRFPPGGSNHFKFAVMKRNKASAITLLGSIDISKSRWDTPAHLPIDPDRDPTLGKPTHDTGVAIEGPAAADVEKTFRERWNDSTRTLGLEPLDVPQPLISSPIASPAAAGTHSVQVLRTYGITSTFFGYSWSPRGEFTVWASYLNAIKRASTYIYIEDQYFLPFDWPPCYARTHPVRHVAQLTDIIYQLGEAIKRGVKVAILTPSNAEDFGKSKSKYQRDIGVNYLQSVQTAGAPGDVVVASLKNGATDVYVHSKLMIVDDEFVLIGSANVGQRSMTCDGELHVGIIDSDNLFAKDLRKNLWAEHTGRDPATLDDPVAAYTTFKSDVAGSAGALKPYPVDTGAIYPSAPGSKPPEVGHISWMRMIFDPYLGPAGLR